jgi:signal transduction histidine kinase
MSVSERNESTFARTRIEKILGRVFSLAALATTAETIANAMSQTRYLNPTILYASIGLILAAQLYTVFTFWFGSARKHAYVFHGIAYAAAFLLYPFSVLPGAVIEPGFRPWLWWAAGIAAMAVGMHLPRWWSIAFVTINPLLWMLLHQSSIGGGASLGTAALEGAYLILYFAAVHSLVGLLKAAAFRLDQKNEQTAELAVQRAAQEATEFERQRLDDLVHDSVLTTLLLAAKAQNSHQHKLAAMSARDAVVAIQQASSENLAQVKDVSVGAYLDALRSTIERGFKDCSVNLSNSAVFLIPTQVGLAISEATIQALTNSFQHAGPKAEREVRLKADHHGLKIVVKDNGRGFWVSKVPKDRFGVRNSIHRRMEHVGGFAKIESAPRKGATVVLRWSPDA